MTRAEEFVKTLDTDSELKAQLSSASSAEEANKIVSDAGYGDVSLADIKSASSDELSDSELATASGAGGFDFHFSI